MCSPATPSVRRLENAYVTGLIALEHKTLSEMSRQNLLPCSIRHAGRLLTRDCTPHRSSLHKRLHAAPQGAVLAVDLVPVLHEGQKIEGVGRVYSSSENGLIWGHAYLSSALVAPEQDAFPLQLAPFPNELMSTPQYPRLMASEALLTIVGDVQQAGYEVRAVVADAQFGTRLVVRSLRFQGVPFVLRCRTDLWVERGRERVQVRTLAEQYPPGRARYYRRFDVYAKRVRVFLEHADRVDLVLVWKRQGGSWHLFALLSSAREGVQGVLEIWRLRWSLEVSHRLFKQNFGLSSCACRSFAAQLKHADLVIEAFLVVRRERAESPELGWRRAQERVALRRRSAALTGLPALVA